MKKKQEVVEEVVETVVEEVAEEVVEAAVEETVEEVTEEVIEETTVEPIEEVVETPVEENQNGEEVTEEVELTGVVTAAKLNVRELPEKTANVVCVINKDDVVTLVTGSSQTHEDFYEVCTADGKLGFCMKQFIKLN